MLACASTGKPSKIWPSPSYPSKDQSPLVEGTDPNQIGAFGYRPTCRSLMAPISKSPGFGSGFGTFMATELSVFDSMGILDSNHSAHKT
jgi:hypothetical protein